MPFPSVLAALLAVHNCSLSVEEGSITGLIGPNGAGKSTLFNMVAGVFPPTSGRILLDDEDVTGLPSHRMFARKLLRTFQIAHEFSHLTVLENLMLVPPARRAKTLSRRWPCPAASSARNRHIAARADEVISFLKLGRVRNEFAGNLSGGQKKLLELGRTMMTEARVVLLDEIAAGVNKTLLADLAANIARLNRELGYTFFVIEHDMDFITLLCDPVIVMAAGTVLAEGPDRPAAA